MKNRAVLDTAVSEKIRTVVKAGFDTMVETLDGAWRASHDGETIDAASKKPDFLARFSAFIKSADQLPGEKLAEFDAAIQSMARLANSITEMNTIMKQYKALLDAANGYVRQGPATVSDDPRSSRFATSSRMSASSFAGGRPNCAAKARSSVGRDTPSRMASSSVDGGAASSAR